MSERGRSKQQSRISRTPERGNPGARNSRPAHGWLSELFRSQFVLSNETTVFILVNALDFFVTYLLLAWPDSPVYEANAIARAMFRWGLRYVIVFKFGLATVAVVSCELVARRNYWLGRSVLIALMILVAAVVAYSLRLVASHLIRI